MFANPFQETNKMTAFIFTTLLACGGNPPKGEPTPPPNITVIDNKDTEEKVQDEHHAEGVHHGEGEHSAAVVEPGPIAEGATVNFVEPQDGATLSSPVKVTMSVTGMIVQPAGELADGTGHHHIIVDSDPVAKGTAVMSDEQHIHFGKGQTETELVLSPGEHTLGLQFANGAHISYGPQLNSIITITVTE